MEERKEKGSEDDGDFFDFSKFVARHEFSIAPRAGKLCGEIPNICYFDKMVTGLFNGHGDIVCYQILSM